MHSVANPPSIIDKVLKTFEVKKRLQRRSSKLKHCSKIEFRFLYKKEGKIESTYCCDSHPVRAGTTRNQ